MPTYQRRADLDTQTRINFSIEAYRNQGIYGKMTEIAKRYQISRTFLYDNLNLLTEQLDLVFSGEKHFSKTDPLSSAEMILSLRLEGKCSLSSISSILERHSYSSYSMGYISEFLHEQGSLLPSTLLPNSPLFVFLLSDEIFAIDQPILISIDAQSTAILKIELADNRSAATWKSHFESLKNHHFIPLGMASDRGTGLVAGYEAAFETKLWVCDHFHEFRDLFRWEDRFLKKAYRAITEEDEQIRKFYNAKSEAYQEKRLNKCIQATEESLKRIEIYEQFTTLCDWLRHALQLVTAFGQIRSADGVEAELISLIGLFEELDQPALKSILQTITAHVDQIIVPYREAEIVKEDLLKKLCPVALDYLCLAWQHDHLIYQSKATLKSYHKRETQDWLAMAEWLLDDQFDALKSEVFNKMDSIIRASSLVEMVNSIIRPYLNTCKGQITQETLNLVMFYHNHRRYLSGKRKGSAPIELFTGEILNKNWIELLLEQTKESKQNKQGTKILEFQRTHKKQPPIHYAKAA